MKCLQCGYCCMNYFVPIVDDPEKGFDPENSTQDNIVMHIGKGQPCKHLRGDKPGEYRCVCHDEPWYKDTPCFSHGQIERDPSEKCRMGVYVLNQEKED